MINLDCPTPTTGTGGNWTIILSDNPVFELSHAIPDGMGEQLSDAILDFIASSKVGEGIDKQGLMNQTFKTIADATVFKQGDFWMARKGNELVGYVLARIVCDVDGRLTYWVSQAWSHKSYRNTPLIKQCWEVIRQRAKDTLCSHLVIVAGRNSRAYKRFLKLHDYATLLKEEL